MDCIRIIAQDVVAQRAEHRGLIRPKEESRAADGERAHDWLPMTNLGMLWRRASCLLLQQQRKAEAVQGGAVRAVRQERPCCKAILQIQRHY
eukprot:4611229-Prymnesium_polylepis.1